MSATGHPASLRRSRRSPVLLVAGLAVAGLLVAALVVSALSNPGPGSADHDRGAAAPVSDRVGPSAREQAASYRHAATRLVSRQRQALTATDRAAFVAGWMPASRRRAAGIYENLRAVGADIASVQVGTASPLTSDARRWVADTHLRWSLPGGRAAHTGLAVTLAGASGSTARIADVEPLAGERTPLWLLPGLVTESRPGMVVWAQQTPTAARVAADLDQVLPGLREALGALPPVAVLTPADRAAFDDVLAAAPRTYDGIAAVTTTLDGSRHQRAPAVVVVNPDVWPTLTATGRRAVLAHEATHAVTGAASTAMPLWLAEGFADQVAVRALGLREGIATRQAAAEARRHGVPATLPRSTDFDRSGPRLELAYQRSLVAVQAIGERFGERRLTAFYRAVVRHPHSLGRQAQRVLGTDTAGLARLYRATLGELADG